MPQPQRAVPLSPSRQAPKSGDAVSQAFENLSQFADLLHPQDIDEPILAPTVAHAVHEWMVELNNAQELAAVRVEPRRMALLYGPPGTGKTTLAHHVASRLGLPLVAARSERIIGSFMGETGRAIGCLFDALKPIEKRCVLLLDEFDALGSARTNGKQGIDRERNQSITVLLTRVEAYRGIGLAATNTKDILDPAMWRRFGLQISVDLPAEEQRFAIIRKYAMPFDLEDSAIDALAHVTRGCSPSLLKQLMEGMKRTLVLAPKLALDIGRPEVVFAHIAASISPPPEMPQPPLWLDPSAVEELQGMHWPPTRA